ncbi:7279_t:CDS:1 [Acaulospora colombiana]|uniref:7279_t:CDS:1 n=1 Tax=Acaulospora colombiana TaxID=27376 RepID=A0ACA9P6U1_9GLOM|nr:7279_t:CDS:1 [Acaulospora colombiana]
MVDGCNGGGITYGGRSNGDGGNEWELLVSLAVGPIHISNCHSYPSSCNNHQLANGSNYLPKPADPSSSTKDLDSDSRKKCCWGVDNYLLHNHGAFVFSSGKYLLIKELWDVGIPGKVWDSAFVMVQMFQDKILFD